MGTHRQTLRSECEAAHTSRGGHYNHVLRVRSLELCATGQHATFLIEYSIAYLLQCSYYVFLEVAFNLQITRLVLLHPDHDESGCLKNAVRLGV